MTVSFAIRPTPEPTARDLDREFAEHAADYLLRQGLTRDEVALALIEQCGLDYATAYQMVV